MQKIVQWYMQREKKYFLLPVLPMQNFNTFIFWDIYSFQNRTRQLPHSSISHIFGAHMNYINIWKATVTFLFSCWFSFSPYRFMAFSCYGLHLIGVPNNHISIWSYSNPSFSWIQIKDFGSIGTGDSYKLALIHLTCGLKTMWLEQNMLIKWKFTM